VTSADADIQGEEDFYGQPIDKFRGSSEGDWWKIF
jgi:hypothetical protein